MEKKIKKCCVCEKNFNYGKHPDKKTCGKECLKKHQINIKDERIKKSKEAFKLKYNVEHNSQLKDFTEKVKKTKKEKYGDENFNNREKAKKTNIKKYGAENAMQVDKIKEKSNKTKKEKYGDENFNNREKAKETIKEKFGVDHHLQLDEVMNKHKKTIKEKYGVNSTFEIQHVKEKRKKVNIEKYGTEFYFESEEFLKKTLTKKMETLNSRLEASNLEFNVSEYDKLREKFKDGSVKYLKYNVKCKICNNEFKIRLVNNALICRYCYPIESCSKLQMEFKEFIDSLNLEYEYNNRNVIKPLEVDFYFEKEKVAIEINGNYYHSEKGGEKNSSYHLNKTKRCYEKQIKLIHIFEDEWILNKEIVKSRIKNLFNITENKIFSRKCEIKNISYEETESFLRKNHIQGSVKTPINIGLYFGDKLVSIMTFSKKRLSLGNKNLIEGEYELIRFCNKINYNVIGSFSKLLNFFIKKYNPKEILTFADCRWSGYNYESTVYFKRNFKFIGYTNANFFFIDKNYLNRQHRFSLRKDVLLKKNNLLTTKKTGWELAQEAGYDRIWDCGSMKFILKL